MTHRTLPGLVLTLLVPSWTAAQIAGGEDAAAAAQPREAPAGTDDAAPDEQTRDEARRHFESGLALMRNDNWDAAALEFQRSLDLLPTRNALFNLGMCEKALFRYVAAMQTFDRFLAQYREQAESDQLRQAEAALEECRGLVAHLAIAVNVDGAEVRVDDRSVGVAPLAEPVAVDPGRHSVEARRDGYGGGTQVATVTPGEQAGVELVLTEIARVGRVRIESNVPQAEVWVDDAHVGTVPFDGELAAGEHRLEVRAAGYATQTQTVAVATGDERIVSVTLARPGGTDPAWFWSAVGLTGAAALAVAGLGTAALVEDRDYSSNPDRTAAQQAEGRRLVLAADVCTGVAAAAAAAALILGFTTNWSGDGGAEQEPAPNVMPSVGVTDGGAALLVLGRF